MLEAWCYSETAGFACSALALALDFLVLLPLGGKLRLEDWNQLLGGKLVVIIFVEVCVDVPEINREDVLWEEGEVGFAGFSKAETVDAIIWENLNDAISCRVFDAVGFTVRDSFFFPAPVKDWTQLNWCKQRIFGGVKVFVDLFKRHFALVITVEGEVGIAGFLQGKSGGVAIKVESFNDALRRGLSDALSTTEFFTFGIDRGHRDCSQLSCCNPVVTACVDEIVDVPWVHLAIVWGEEVEIGIGGFTKGELIGEAILVPSLDDARCCGFLVASDLSLALSCGLV